MYRRILGLIWIVFAVFAPAAAQEPPPITAGWREGAPMTTRRSELASALLDGQIYVGGGIGENWTTRTEFERYDIPTDTWETLAPMPVGLHHLGMAAAGGRVYVTGGYADMNFTTDQAATYVYDPTANTWTQAADMPAPRAAHAMVSIGGQLYVVGGLGPGADALWIYDPESDTWDTSAPSLPTPREHLGAAALDTQLYVAGGRVDGGNLPVVEYFDTLSRTWTRLPDMPSARGGITAGAMDGVVHVTGGEAFSPEVTYNQHEAFELGDWKMLEPMPTARHGLTSQTYRGSWYVIGGATEAVGRTSETATTLVEIYTTRAAYPDDTRTGIATLDAVIAAMLANDTAALADLVHYTSVECVAQAEGLGGPPLCEEGEAEGTVVEVLPQAFSHGSYTRRADIMEQLPQGDFSLYAAYHVSAETREPYFPVGQYAAVFVDESLAFYNGLTIHVTDDGIVRIDYGRPVDLVAAFGADEAILPPLVQYRL